MKLEGKKFKYLEKKQVSWICNSCAKKLGGDPRKSLALCNMCATYHNDVCDVCGKTVAVTEPRDFGLSNFIEYIEEIQ